jgi:hypothetical protein
MRCGLSGCEFDRLLCVIDGENKTENECGLAVLKDSPGLDVCLNSAALFPIHEWSSEYSR